MLSRLTKASQYLASSAGVAYISRKNSCGTSEPPMRAQREVIVHLAAMLAFSAKPPKCGNRGVGFRLR
jgi:hypothetical protein